MAISEKELSKHGKLAHKDTLEIISDHGVALEDDGGTSLYPHCMKLAKGRTGSWIMSTTGWVVRVWGSLRPHGPWVECSFHSLEKNRELPLIQQSCSWSFPQEEFSYSSRRGTADDVCGIICRGWWQRELRMGSVTGRTEWILTVDTQQHGWN